MPDVTWTHPGLSLILDSIPSDAKRVLDVGCGRGIIGALCRIYRSADEIVGVDAYAPYLEFCREHKLYSRLESFDLTKSPLPFADKEFDVVTCVEVIEHLPKQQGEKLIEELERVGRKTIITTPTVFYEQSEYDSNPHQKHRSVWSVSDFRIRGYKVRGAGEVIFAGRPLRYISLGFSSLGYFFPLLSSYIICSKSRG